MHISITATPIRSDFLSQARQTGVDDLQQPVVHAIAQGGEPCRDALRRARPGEALILASYCPFSQAGPYREYGPVFILQSPDTDSVNCLSLPTGHAEDYLQSDKPVVLRAYNEREVIVAASLVQPTQIEAELATYFLQEDISFVLQRFAAYGCYGTRFDRPAKTQVPI